MITATVKYNDNYTDIEFPCSEAYLSAKLMEIHVDDLSSTTQYISAITEPNELSFLKDKMINLDEINYLAKRMDSFFGDEETQFFEAIKLEHFTEMKDLINLTFNLDKYTLIKDVSDTEIDAEKFCNEKSALFIIMPEENPATFFMISLIIQQLYREILAVADENGGKLKNRCVFFCDEYGTLPKIESAEMMFSASRSRRLQIVPIIQSFSQLEKNYGKEGAEIIVDNTQLTIFGGFAPQSTSAETLSKALGSRTVMSGSVSRSKNDPSESLQMIERPLMTPDELKSMPKGQFVVMKTGFYPMKVKLKLFFKWGIHFDEDHPYTVADQGNREVKYASKKDITDGIIKKYHPELLEPAAPPDDETPSGGQNQQMTEHHQPASMEKNDGKDKNGGTALHPVPKNRRTPLPQTPKNAEVTSDGQA